jgi:hypothetical protein
MISSSIMTINPDNPDAHVLRGWYDTVGANQSFTAYSNAGSGSGGATFNRAEMRTIEDVKADMQAAEKAEMFSCRGTILHIRGENPAYPACPNQSCKKKVEDIGEGWRCEKCERTWEKPEYRYASCDPVLGSLLTLSSGTLFPWRSLTTLGKLGCKVSTTSAWLSSTCPRMSSWKSRYAP